MAVHTNLDALEELGPSWARLPLATPFGGFAFSKEWLACHRDSAEPFVIAQTDAAGELVGLAPWAVIRARNGARKLTGIGAADAGYHDPIVRHAPDLPGFATEVARTLRERRREWDVLALTLRADDSAPVLEALPRVGWPLTARLPWERHSLIDLAGGWEAYWESRERRFDDVRRKRRRLALQPHRFYLATGSEVLPALDDLFRLHAATLVSQGDWRDLYAFLRAYAPGAVERGEAVVPVLEVGGARAAIDLVLRYGSAAYGLLRAFDPEFRQAGVGTLLTLWILEQLAIAGVTVVDCGAGNHEWKERFRTRELETVGIQIPVSPAGCLALDWVLARRHASERLGWLRRRAA